MTGGLRRPDEFARYAVTLKATGPQAEIEAKRDAILAFASSMSLHPDLVKAEASFHDAIANVLMCDGSVKAVSENIGHYQWAAQATRSGADTVGF